MVSVDVKHHDYLLTLSYDFAPSQRMKREILLSSVAAHLNAGVTVWVVIDSVALGIVPPPRPRPRPTPLPLNTTLPPPHPLFRDLSQHLSGDGPAFNKSDERRKEGANPHCQQSAMA